MKIINKIAIVYSATRKTDEALVKVGEIIDSLDAEVVFSSNIKKLNSIDLKKISKADLILVLGGDGTMIGSMRNLYSLNVPFLGINSGTVGFLTDLPLDKIEKLNEIIKGNYIKESRPIFEAYTDNDNKEIFLNEVVIHSGSVTKMLDLELSLKKQVIYNLKADGLIISSSTGSTAYSYSGGGPIISPKLDAISLLPMFSHSSSSHSLLLSNKEEVTVKIKNKNLSSIQIFVDGKKNLKYSNHGLKVSSTKKLLNFTIQKTIITLRPAGQSLVGLYQSSTLKTKEMNTTRILLVFLYGNILLSPFAFSQTAEDLSYLNLLPENQAQSIAERLGIQTGKPLNEEIKMDTFDEPKFDNSIPKEDFMSQDVKQDIDSNIFGMSFFKDSPSTFAPIDLAPAPKDYVIGPGDEIRVQLFGNLDINRLIPVNREGNIIIPEIGVLNVSGLCRSNFISNYSHTNSCSNRIYSYFRQLCSSDY